MAAPLSREVMQRRTNAGFIAAFFLFLWLPTADTFLHFDRTHTVNENRAPAAFPEFKAEFGAIHDFVGGVEAYFGDHFGFRKRLIAWEHHWKWQWFRTAKANNVLVGKSGWLFFSGGLMIDDVMGNRPFSDKELAAWRDLLTGRRDWLAQRGIRYLFVIPPDKHTVYPEELPDWLAGAAHPPQRLDQFVQYMKAHSDVPVLDLRPALLEAKKDGRVYMQTDTHWNETGAFAACRRIVETIDALGFPLKAPDRSAFQTATADEPSGDLARMLGQEKTLLEKDVVTFAPKPPLAPLPIRMDTGLAAKNWKTGVEPRVSDNPEGKGKAVVFRDSFSILLSRFLGYSFRRVAYVWEENWDKRIIETEKPDIVVDEMLERFLITRDPLELKKKDEQKDAQVFGDE